MRKIAVIDTAMLSRRAMMVLELDTPNPMVGVSTGMPILVNFGDGHQETSELSGLGFASSTPEHAHIIVRATTYAQSPIVSIELE